MVTEIKQAFAKAMGTFLAKNLPKDKNGALLLTDALGSKNRRTTSGYLLEISGASITLVTRNETQKTTQSYDFSKQQLQVEGLVVGNDRVVDFLEKIYNIFNALDAGKAVALIRKGE